MIETIPQKTKRKEMKHEGLDPWDDYTDEAKESK